MNTSNLLAGLIVGVSALIMVAIRQAGDAAPEISLWLAVLDCFVIGYVFSFVIDAGRNIGSRQPRTSSFLVVIFYLIYVAPVIFDHAQGIPDYPITRGYRDPARSETVRVIYDLFVMFVPVLLQRFTRGTLRARGGTALTAGKRAQGVLWLVLVSPVLALLFAPQPLIYTRYAMVLLESMAPEVSAYHALVALLCVLGLVSGACLLLARRNFGRTLGLVTPLMATASWIQGKRSAVALSFMLVFAVAWMRGYLTKGNLIRYGTIAAIVFSSYVAWYQATFRPATVAAESVYENSRIDYGRDHCLRAAIFAELPENYPILEYRGQSMLFYATMPVPRVFWPDKPWPYAHYITAHALQTPAAELGWGLTSSFLDEAVANFGWFGLIIGPLLFIALCRICDATPDPLVKVVGVLLGCLLMMVEFVAFAPLAIVWAVYSIWSSRVTRRDSSATAKPAVYWLRA